MSAQARILSAALLVGVLGTGVPACAADDTPAFYRHASSCVAVLKRDALALAPRAATPDAEARARMVVLTEWGFAFIGAAYEQGLRNPRADELLKEAEQAQSALDADALHQLSAACQVEGAKLLDERGGLMRALARNRANARVDKLLADQAARAPK
ncbi:MAG: hypothetical protein KGN16_01940 [Burkholderiales bacterium]|nr:hypothetical protein [Burkholderiales bacterium]